MPKAKPAPAPAAPAAHVFMQIRLPALIRDRMKVRAANERRSLNMVAVLMLEEAMAVNRPAYRRDMRKAAP